MSTDFGSSIGVKFLSEIPAKKRKRTVSTNHLTAVYLYILRTLERKRKWCIIVPTIV
jgi:hypothetical protein